MAGWALLCCPMPAVRVEARVVVQQVAAVMQQYLLLPLQ
jgi:hypothetical protein